MYHQDQVTMQILVSTQFRIQLFIAGFLDQSHDESSIFLSKFLWKTSVQNHMQHRKHLVEKCTQQDSELGGL